MAPPAHHAAARALAIALALVAAGALAGCKDEFGRPIKGESVLDFLSPPSPVEAAAWAADPYDADKRTLGLLLLSNAYFGGERVYLEMYRFASEDTDAGVRAVALAALARHGLAEDAARVAAHINDPDEHVRWHACRAMQRMHRPEAVPALIERLDPAEESSAQVRAAAAVALGQYRERRVAQGLVRALGERDMAVNDSALDSLRSLTGKDFGYDERPWVTFLRDEQDPFAGAVAYSYPVFQRDKSFFEWLIPFVPQPPNEVPGPVIGAPVAAAGAAPAQPDATPAPAPAGGG